MRKKLLKIIKLNVSSIVIASLFLLAQLHMYMYMSKCHYVHKVLR